MSASPSERQLPTPTPGSYNNPIVLEDSPTSPWQDDVVLAPRLPQKKPRKERSDKGKHRIKSGDMGKRGPDELESRPNRPKPVNSSAASQQRKRRRNLSLNCAVLAPDVAVAIGAQDREGAIGTPPKDQQPAVMGSNHHPDHSPEISDHVTGAANISNAAADLPQDLHQKMIPKEFGSFSPLSPTAIKEVCVFVFTAPLCSIRVDCVALSIMLF
jgi:hypothetical protein